MKNLFCLLIMLLSCAHGFAQVNSGDILMVKDFGGIRFSQDGRLMKPKHVLNVMEGNTEAYDAFKKAKANYDAGNVFEFIN